MIVNCASVKGGRHIDEKKPCEDSSGYWTDDISSIIVVSDGHSNKMKSDKGSMFAVQSTIDVLYNSISKKSFLKDIKNEHEQLMSRIEKDIVSNWSSRVDTDRFNIPFKEVSPTIYGNIESYIKNIGIRTLNDQGKKDDDTPKYLSEIVDNLKKECKKIIDSEVIRTKFEKQDISWSEDIRTLIISIIPGIEKNVDNNKSIKTTKVNGVEEENLSKYAEIEICHEKNQDEKDKVKYDITIDIKKCIKKHLKEFSREIELIKLGTHIDKKEYGATLVCAVIFNDYVFGFQVGDGGAYAAHADGRITQLMELDNCCIGTQTTSLSNDDVHIHHFCKQKKDIVGLIVCTDGVTGCYDDNNTKCFIRDIFSKMDTNRGWYSDIIHSLIKLANDENNKDDVSLAICCDSDANFELYESLCTHNIPKLEHGGTRFTKNTSKTRNSCSKENGIIREHGTTFDGTIYIEGIFEEERFINGTARYPLPGETVSGPGIFLPTGGIIYHKYDNGDSTAHLNYNE